VRPRAKVTIESLYEVVYKKSLGIKINDLDLCLEVVSRSRQPLRYIWRWISRKPLEAWFQRTTNRKWYVLSNGYVTDDLTWPWKVKLVTPIRLERNISKTTWAGDFKFGTQLYMGNAGRTNNVPWKWAWPRSRDPTIFGIWSNISPKLLELEISNLVRGFVWGMTSLKWAWPWPFFRGRFRSSHRPAPRTSVVAIWF